MADTASSPGPREVKIFVSSPGDVMPERQRLERVAERLNGQLGGAVHLTCVRWEERFYTADRTFQAQIAPSIACDLVVSIFWTRLGTALPPEFGDKLPDGRAYPSGTAYELLTALEASKQKSLPDVFVFRKTAAGALPTDNPAARQAFNRQLDSLEAFWEEWFLNREGQFRAAFNSFNNTDEFEAQIERLLRHWLDEKGLLRRAVRWRIEERGSPFRGLLPFEASHAEVFFGRSAEIERGRERLIDGAARNASFLLMLGASGTGKSSLARAGLIPRLLQPGAIAGPAGTAIDAWRVAVFAPGIGQHDPLKALAAALLDTAALPELAETPNSTVDGLAGQLAQGGEAAAGLVRWALDRVARQVGEKERYERPVVAKLVLLADQFESLFAGEVSADRRRAFIAALDGLVRSGLVWVIATLRSTDYALMQAEPGLLKLKEDGATLDLAPPDSVAIAEAIDGPAEAAGLAFERDAENGRGLDQMLRAEAGGADALPLLQFTLQNLFEAREEKDGTPTLTLAAYRALGGIEGAIAAEAERTVSALSPEAQAQLPWLLRQLVGVSGHRQDAPATLRDMALDADELARRPGAQALIDALVAARVLVLSVGEDGPASGKGTSRRARLAHEAVLRGWQRARSVVADNARFFRVRAETTDAFARWQRESKAKELLLPAGTPLAEAEALVAGFGDELPADLCAYVRASRRRADRARHVAYAIAAGMAVLFVASAVAGVWAWRAEFQAGLQRDQALVAQSRHIATQARQLAQQGDVGTALALALEALPSSVTRPERPYDVLAEGALLEQTLHMRERVIFAGHKGQVTAAAISPDGKRLLTSSWDRTARLWDLATGKELAVLEAHGQPLTAATFSRDGKLIATASMDGLVGLWDSDTAKPLVAFKGHTSVVSSVAFSPDGTKLVSGGWDKTARLWDVASGKEIRTVGKHTDPVNAVAFSPDGSRIATADEDGSVRLWDAASDEEKLVIKLERNATGIAFSPNGKRFAVSSWDRTATVWDSQAGTQVAVMRGHQDSLAAVLFSPNGELLVTGSWDRTVRFWVADSGHEVAVLRGHAGIVQGLALSSDSEHLVTASADYTARLWKVGLLPEQKSLKGHTTIATAVAFSPDGTLVLSPSYNKVARLWNVASGKEIRQLVGHENVVIRAAFSPDGGRIVTASYDKTARIWDTPTGRELVVLTGHDQPVTGAAFSPDGKLVATAGWDTTARTWDAATGKDIAVFRGHDKGYVHAVAFSPDGNTVASVGNDSMLRFWDPRTGAERAKIMGHDSTIVALAWDRDGKRVVTGALDKTARIWDVATGKQIAVLRGHEHTVTSVAFSPDGVRVATASSDSTVRLWDAANGRELAILRGHIYGNVNGVAFSPDGRWLASVGADSQVLLWPHLRDQELLDKGCAVMVRPLSRAQRAQYFLEAEPASPRCGKAPLP
jgi:WD40 repeat protein